jgi:Tfp pilus tip-associated adhesin PilY1
VVVGDQRPQRAALDLDADLEITPFGGRARPTRRTPNPPHTMSLWSRVMAHGLVVTSNFNSAAPSLSLYFEAPAAAKAATPRIVRSASNGSFNFFIEGSRESIATQTARIKMKASSPRAEPASRNKLYQVCRCDLTRWST